MNEMTEASQNTSLKRVEANRKNCQKSTGPRTKRGKATSRMNAIKHGMLSSQVVVRGLQVRERTKDFQEMRDRLWEELAPVGTMEEMLVDRIVTAHWRMRRALTAESGEIVLSVDGGHWKREKRGPERFQRMLERASRPDHGDGESASGLSYLMSRFGDLRRDMTRKRGGDRGGHGSISEAIRRTGEFVDAGAGGIAKRADGESRWVRR